jgi:hypothetical protein
MAVRKRKLTDLKAGQQRYSRGPLLVVSLGQRAQRAHYEASTDPAPVGV